MRSSLVATALVAALLLSASAGAAPKFAQPGEIEGVVTKAPGGTPVEGVEICAFDVAEDEEFTECTESKSDGSYEIIGLDEGPYRVQFEPGESGLKLASQYYRGAVTQQAATNVWVNEGKASTGIDAEMQPAGDSGETQDGCPQSAAFQGTCPAVNLVPGYSVTSGAIQVKVTSSARTPVAVTAALPGPGSLQAKKTVAPGKPSTFTLAIPSELASRLRQIDSSKSLTLTLRAHATKVNGSVSTDQLSVPLKGRG